ncbi:hypothetical protein DFH27DRAFT_229984 [Peziza echinospora]|nr:hypothetical protein DFH27DRAFT_229984 [Peziza echinospora]
MDGWMAAGSSRHEGGRLVIVLSLLASTQPPPSPACRPPSCSLLWLAGSLLPTIAARWQESSSQAGQAASRICCDHLFLLLGVRFSFRRTAAWSGLLGSCTIGDASHWPPAAPVMNGPHPCRPTSESRKNCGICPPSLPAESRWGGRSPRNPDRRAGLPHAAADQLDTSSGSLVLALWGRSNLPSGTTICWAGPRIIPPLLGDPIPLLPTVPLAVKQFPQCHPHHLPQSPPTIPSSPSSSLAF